MPSRAAKPDRTTLYVLGGLALVVAVAVYVLHTRSASAGVDVGQSPSVRPGSGGGTGADAPGGATSQPGNLPASLSSDGQVDAVTAAVQNGSAPTQNGSTGAGVASGGYSVAGGPPTAYTPSEGGYATHEQAAANNYLGGIPGVTPIAGVNPGSGNLTSRGKVVA